MAAKNACDESLRGQCRSNVLPLCAPSARLALDDIPLYGDVNEFFGFPEEEAVDGEATYISKWLDDPSARRLARWLRDNGVPNPMHEFHILLFEQRTTFQWEGVQDRPITVRPHEMYLERFEKNGKHALNLYLASLKLWARRETIENALQAHTLKSEWRMKISHDVKGWRPRARLYPINFRLVFKHESCSRSRRL
jgi:hypothetical protein